jgi:predicted nucleic acid-binding protein
VVKWFLPEALAEAALRVAGSDHAFLAPDLLSAEFASTLWKKRRRGEVEGEQAVQMLADFALMPIETFPIGSLIPSAFALATAAGHSVYDCLYIALADREDCPLVTADRRFLQSFADGPLGYRFRWIEAC